MRHQSEPPEKRYSIKHSKTRGYSLFDSVGEADAGSSTYPSDEGMLTLI